MGLRIKRSDPGQRKWGVSTNLPAGFYRKSGDLHPVGGPARLGDGALIVVVVPVGRATLAVSAASGKLDRQAFTHEVGSV